jgi:conjugal transfer pilus assembly protein TraW
VIGLRFMPPTGSLMRVLVGSALLLPTAVSAKDYGQRGAVFPVIETDMLAMIEARLMAAKASGRMAAMQRQFVADTEARVRRPVPVKGIQHASAPRSWTYDPSITVGQDIRDAAGRLIIARGTRVNPLDHVTMRERLVFIDGDDPAEVRWALASMTALDAKIVLTSGAPIALMDATRRRIYFDQNGVLTTKFGIRHVPAVIAQTGKLLRVSELVTPASGKGTS